MKLPFGTVVASLVFIAPVAGWQAAKSPAARGTTPSSQTAVTKDGRTVILKNDGTWEYAAKTPKPADTPAAQANSAPVKVVQKPTRQPSITLEEKIKLWKGQKVIILPSRDPNPKYFAPRYPAAHVRLRRYSESEKFELTTKQQNIEFFKTYDSLGLPTKEYAGRTGVVLDVQKRDLADYPGILEYLVALDGSGEKVVVRNGDPDDPDLGFFAEMELARSYVGQSVWRKQAWDALHSYVGQSDSGGVPVKHTQRMTVSRAEWRTDSNDSPAIVLWFKSDTGQEAPKHADCNFDDKFAIKHRYLCFSDTDDFYYFEDPRAKFPNWPRQIWQLIENQEVAVGMTEDMAKLACAPRMERAGVILSGDALDIIYRGCNKKFVIAGGKVTKYVE